MDKDKRKSFVFYRDWYDTICKLDEKTGFELSKAIMAIAFGEEPKNLSNITEAMLMLVRPQIKRDIDKWLEIREKRQESGKMGGLAKQANATKSKQMLPSDSKSKQDIASVGVNVDVDVDVNDNEEKELVLFEEKEDTTVSPKKKKVIKEFVPPTLQEVRDYIKEKGYNFSAKAFIEYYEADNWHYGKGNQRKKVSNWKRCCATWGNNHSVDTTYNCAYPTSVDDVKDDDIMPAFAYFQYWVANKMSRVWENMTGTERNNGWPENEETYRYLIEHTVEGARGLCYTILVFNRDGWDKYYDERGFMHTYANFIKANGLYKGQG